MVWNKEIFIAIVFNFALEYAIKKVQENEEGVEWMEHINSWSVLKVLIYCVKNVNAKKENRSSVRG